MTNENEWLMTEQLKFLTTYDWMTNDQITNDRITTNWMTDELFLKQKNVKIWILYLTNFNSYKYTSVNNTIVRSHYLFGL